MTSSVLFHIVFVIVSICIVQHGGAIKLRVQSRNHRAQPLSDQQVIKLAQLSNVSHFEATFNEILVPRVVGTASHEKVKNFIFNSMQDLGWHVELDTFKDNTPIFGQLTFHNVIATLNPHARRNLVVACHYDSKYFEEGVFLAATDSAVPCAMMINLAHTMVGPLRSIKDKNDLSLQFIFFDGEEAFQTWSASDSIYGARHLADIWSRTPAVDGNSYLDRIDVMVLLDLLGAPEPHFFSFFQNTETWYRLLVDAEARLSALRQQTRYSVVGPGQRYFHEMSTYGGVEDDHVPFQKRNVPILHVIPMPFPKVWHKLSDDRSAVDPPTCENLNMIMRVFVAEYLRLTVAV